MQKKLTPKQKKFAELYAQSGNAAKSAVGAGYSKKTARIIGRQNLTKLNIQNHIKKLTQEESDNRIAMAKERQEFWTEMMRNKSEDPKHRLKASEILGRAQGDFIDRHHITGISTVNPEDLSDAELAQIVMADDTGSKNVH